MTDTTPRRAPEESLLDCLARIVADTGTRERLAADPRGFLTEQGLAGLDPGDVHRMIPLLADSVAARTDGTFEPSGPVPGPGPHPGETATDAVVRLITYLSDHVHPSAGPVWRSVD